MAGSDAGHAFPALGLAAAFSDAGDDVVVYTGARWQSAAARRGLTVRPLPGLAAREGEDDADAGAKLSSRAARMAVELAPLLAIDDVDLVVSDVITVAGGWAAELAGIPWIELSPHPLYEQSKALPPIGAGLEAGERRRDRIRDAALRGLGAPARARGLRQRRRAREDIGLIGDAAPAARFVATLPGLEVPRPDWPVRTHLIGPLFFEPTDAVFDVVPERGPLVVVCPSTAETGSAELGEVALSVLAERQKRGAVRVVYSALNVPDDLSGAPSGLVAGLARQDRAFAQADLVVCGGGHGTLAKALSAGVPVVVVPGGGDQWELANRVERAGAGRLVRPVTRGALQAAIDDVLGDPSYARRAAEIGATASSTVGPLVVARRVLARTKGRRS
ncbi:MAG: glycosyltransferase [Gordonia sp. (in: high G+C Gram-positive bacteria)]